MRGGLGRSREYAVEEMGSRDGEGCFGREGEVWVFAFSRGGWGEGF